MYTEVDSSTIDSIISECKNISVITDKIRKLLYLKKELDNFTDLQCDFTSDYHGTIDALPYQILQKKVIAQNMLNLYYNHEYFKECKQLRTLDQLVGHQQCIKFKDIISNGSVNIDEVVSSILYYVVLFQCLLKAEKRNIVKICEYCDNVIKEDELECSICLAGVHPYYKPKRKTYVKIEEDSLNKEIKLGNSLLQNGQVPIPLDRCSDRIGNIAHGNLMNREEKYIENDNEEVERGNDIRNVVEGEEVKWPCPSCTFMNTVDRRCCDICFTLRKLEIIDDTTEKNILFSIDIAEVTKESWNCEECDSTNLYDTYICAFCERYAPFFHKWRCERCSFFNDDLAHECAVCYGANEHLRTCTKCQKNEVNEEFDEVCVACEYDVIDTKECSAQIDDINEWEIIEPKSCSICKKMHVELNDRFCSECNQRKWHCNNHRCGAINYDGAMCFKCKLKKGSNVTDFNTVEVFNGVKYMMMWQCTFCGLFIDGHNCTQCRNRRHYRSCIKCSCKWSNPPRTSHCGKCNKLLS